MCEVCDALNEISSVGGLLSLKVREHSHHLALGDDAAADRASGEAVNLLHRLMALNKKFVKLAKEVRPTDGHQPAAPRRRAG